MAAPLSQGSPADTTPAMLYASSSVVIEERVAPSRGTILDLLASNQGLSNSQGPSAEELAFLALGGSAPGTPSLTLEEHSKLRVPNGPLDEASWEDLLASLAADRQQP
jgi:hypothetical protein